MNQAEIRRQVSARRKLLRQLRRILPSHGLIVRGEDTVVYECDAFTVFRQKPWAVVLPEDEDQVRGVLQACERVSAWPWCPGEQARDCPEARAR